MIVSWNVRGINNAGKSREVFQRLNKLNPVLAILVETRVKQQKAQNIRNKMGSKWQYLDNYEKHSNGRIWIMWNENKIRVKMLENSDQFIHLEVENLKDKTISWCTAVYAHNAIHQRRKLWEDLEKLQYNGAWCIIGDFNNVLTSLDRIGGKEVQESEYADLNTMMEKLDMVEKDTIGDHFTWFNKHVHGAIYSRIDRCIGNLDWMVKNANRILRIMEAGVSDHALLCLEEEDRPKVQRYAFKFQNAAVNIEGIKEVISAHWNQHVSGTAMFRLWRKMLMLRNPIRNICRQFKGIGDQLNSTRNQLNEVQSKLKHDRLNCQLIEETKKITEEVIRLNNLEEQLLFQRAKINWIKMGDGNNKYFHAVLKSKYQHTSMRGLLNNAGEYQTDQGEMETIVVDFYRDLVGKTAHQLKGINIVDMRKGAQLTDIQKQELISPVTEKEIKDALFSIDDNTAPGIDGYGSKFFKTYWEIVKKDVCEAVWEFYNSGKMLTAINCTLVTLIPKIPTAAKVSEYRPISCCTTVYKIISKVMTKRLSKVIASIIDMSQAAFIPGKHIQDHILLAYDLLKGYNNKYGPPKCMIQMDLQKAYDSVEWIALENILKEMNFPNRFIHWVMLTVTTVSYRYKVNGEVTNILKAKKGLRQGDPLSPLLFVIVMEYLHRKLQRLKEIPDFNFHAKCEKINLIEVSFADDLLLFVRGDRGSVEILMKTFTEFSEATGLTVNPSKCKVFFSNVAGDEQEQILHTTGFVQGKIPFKYLGIPMSNKKLSTGQCLMLAEKLTNRIRHWSTKCLSFAGRLQLINSILFATANYWLQVMPVPKSVVKKIEAICRSYLWSNSENITRKSPIAWKKICQPKEKGGLNVIDFETWNVACLAKLLWNLSGKQDSLWIKWVNTYILKNQDIMQSPIRNSQSWIMKGILHVRGKIEHLAEWEKLKHRERYNTSSMYKELQGEQPRVEWRHVMIKNQARPRAMFTLWMTCHKKLATKDRLLRFHMIHEDSCCFCNEKESINHLFFDCQETNRIWRTVLNWIQIPHVASNWNEELEWLSKKCKGKGWKAMVLKCAIAETVYHVWNHRNTIVFGGESNTQHVIDNIINCVSQRLWGSPRLRKHISLLMLP